MNFIIILQPESLDLLKEDPLLALQLTWSQILCTEVALVVLSW